MSQVDRQCSVVLASTDWSQTALGAYDTWSQSLKSFVAMVLDMPTPAIIFWGPDQIQLYNDGYSVIMGPRHPKYFGAPYRECWPETHPVIYPWMERVLHGEVIETKDTLIALTRHGFTEEAYFTFTFSPLRDDSGAIAGILQPVVEVTGDVLGRRRADMFRVLRATSDAAGSVGELMAALAVNPHDLPLAAFYGLDSGGRLQRVAATGVELADEVPAVVAEAHEKREAALVPAAAVLGDREHVGPWPEPTREAYVVPLLDGNVQHGVLVLGVSPRLRFDDTYRELFVAIARDLVAMLDRIGRGHAEQSLQLAAEAARVELDHERKQLHALFNEAPVAIAVLAGPSYVVELANPLVLAIWGRDETIRARPLFEAMPDIAGQGLEMLLDHVRTTRQPYIGTEVLVKMRRNAGFELEERYFNFVYHPMAAASGHVGSVVVVANDVTSHVLARRAAETLAIELDSARREAEHARDEAQQANRAKDEFLAMLGHELRNPLAPIFTALDLMRLRGGPAATSRETEVIERQSRHLAGLVDDLLDVSRITSGKIELKRHLLALDDVLAKAIETASPLFEKRRHELRVDVQPGLLVDGDSARLVQVFANLLTNAAKYTDPGGLIEVTARRDGDGIGIEVRDNGRGISADMLTRIFDLFAQEAQNSDRAQGGLGLGLAIVKSLVTMHGGQVSARSDGAKRGSTFTVRLPIAAALTQVDPIRDPSSWEASLAEVHQRVLIVDDNEDAATLLAEALTALGYSCAVAHDGPKALEVAGRQPFDAVVLDIGLPAMDGYEVARHLRSMPGFNAVPLVAITGYGQHDDKQRSIAAGFDHHFVKPVDMTALAKALADTDAA